MQSYTKAMIRGWVANHLKACCEKDHSYAMQVQNWMIGAESIARMEAQDQSLSEEIEKAQKEMQYQYNENFSRPEALAG